MPATPQPAIRTHPFLSKSRIQSGRQCHKRLWLELHRPDAVTWGEAAQFRLDEGTRFGALARELLGGGTLIEADHRQARKALADTRGELDKPREQVPMLFEPAFEHEDVRVRIDACQRRADGDTLIEVKSSTSVKDEYLWDCAIQTWVARGAGRHVDRIVLAHIDNDFVYRRAGDYDGLLEQADITAQVDALLPEIPGIVAQLKAVAAGTGPDIATGPQCSRPYVCPCWNHCRAAEPAPPEYPVDLLPRAAAFAERLRESGYRDLRDVPEALLSHPLYQRIAQATRSGAAFVSPELAPTLDAIPWPRHYLDFETIAFVVPRWLGTRPFQQLPFQFSCHVEHGDGGLQRREFLDLSGASPLSAFADALLAAIGETGPILVWNQGFEAGRVRELATMFPDRAEALLALVERMIDLLPIYRAHYYHRDMRGSWSIKAVLPTVAPELDYGELEIGDGGSAQTAYLRATDLKTSDEEKERLRRHLLAYCERDTYALVRLAQWRPTPSE